MRIWVVGRGIPCKENGMLGSFELEQASMLRKRGAQVIYFAVSVRSAHNLKNIGTRYTTIDGIPVASFNFPLGRILPVKKTDDIFTDAFRRLSKKMIQEYGLPDIIHVHYPSQRPYESIKELQRARARIVATEHWTRVQDQTLSPGNLRNLKAFSDNADALVCVSGSLRDAVKELTNTEKTIRVIPNVVNPVFSGRRLPHREFRFVTSGRLVPVKQFDKVAQAFIDTFPNATQVHLTIVGGGEEYARISKIVQASGMSERIHMTGAVSRERMAEIMSASDVLVSYSRLETFCVPVIEAWMCGLPVIVAADTPVAVDHRDERLGIFVDCDDLETLRKAMRNVYDQYRVYDSEWIRDYAQKRFSEQSVAARLVELYESLDETA